MPGTAGVIDGRTERVEDASIYVGSRGLFEFPVEFFGILVFQVAYFLYPDKIELPR